MLSPIKIKICDRDQDMSLHSEEKYAKVKEKKAPDVVIVKPIDKILLTDEVLEYLSGNYIAPIIIRIPDDMFYTYDIHPRTIWDITQKTQGHTIGDEILNDKTIFDIMYEKVPRIK